MREPRLILAIGRKGVGKSFATIRLMKQILAGNPAKGTPSRRVLILDVNDEFSEFKPISLNSVSIFSVHPMLEIRRVRPFNEETGNKMTLDELAEALNQILLNYKNGFLLIEDISRYISDAMPGDITGAVATNRHSGVDIMLHYQSIGRVQTKIWQNLSLIRLHKFTDSVKRHRNKYEDKYEYLSIAELIVNKRYEDGDKRFFLYVDVEEEKIFGAFSDAEYESAVSTFISHNYSSMVNPLLQARNEQGKKIHTAVTAMQEVKKRFMAFKK